MNGSLPDSSIHRIFQARKLEWVAISFSRGSAQPRDRTQVSRIVGRRFYHLSQQESRSPVYITYITPCLLWARHVNTMDHHSCGQDSDKLALSISKGWLLLLGCTQSDEPSKRTWNVRKTFSCPGRTVTTGTCLQPQEVESSPWLTTIKETRPRPCATRDMPNTCDTGS